MIGNMFLLLKSYLTERSQFVNFDGCQSNYENIDVCLPQGSVLRPLLLLIYIKDQQDILV